MAYKGSGGIVHRHNTRYISPGWDRSFDSGFKRCSHPRLQEETFEYWKPSNQ